MDFHSTKVTEKCIASTATYDPTFFPAVFNKHIAYSRSATTTVCRQDQRLHRGINPRRGKIHRNCWFTTADHCLDFDDDFIVQDYCTMCKICFVVGCVSARIFLLQFTIIILECFICEAEKMENISWLPTRIYTVNKMKRNKRLNSPKSRKSNKKCVNKRYKENGRLFIH